MTHVILTSTADPINVGDVKRPPTIRENLRESALYTLKVTPIYLAIIALRFL